MVRGMPFRSRLLSGLNLLTTPPSKESVWIGPFDQLVSSAYAFLAADELGFAKRSIDGYYHKVFCQIVKLVSKLARGREPSDSPAFKNYLSGIYFNAGFQRLTWAAERLITTFAAVECTCANSTAMTRDAKGYWPKFGESIKAAKKRLERSHFDLQLPHFRGMLDQFDGWDRRSYDLSKALSILRDQVNPKKHSVYDYQQVQQSRPLKSRGPWTSVDRISLAVHAFEVVSEAYCELVDWNPKAALK
jgi:hypothetical protein